jgi:hypothetical protein
MTPRILYRAAAVLLVLFAAGHQFGFRQVDPSWQADAVVQSMRTTRFAVQGFTRDYWSFFSGFGFFVTVLLIFSALLAWQLGGVSPEVRAGLALARWSLAIAYAAIAVLTWRYFFLAPGILATLVAICLAVAAAL